MMESMIYKHIRQAHKIGDVLARFDAEDTKPNTTKANNTGTKWKKNKKQT